MMIWKRKYREGMTVPWPLNMKVIRVFQIFTLCIILASEACNENDNNRTENLWTYPTHQSSTNGTSPPSVSAHVVCHFVWIHLLFQKMYNDCIRLHKC